MAKIISFSKTIAAAATPEPLMAAGAAERRCAYVHIQNNDTTNPLWVGASNVTNANGAGIKLSQTGGTGTDDVSHIELEISSSVDPDPIYLDQIYIAATANGQVVSVLALIV